VADDVRQRWKVGDRVCGAVHGANPIDNEIGTFADYVIVNADFAWRMPKGMEWEEAAVAGSAVAWLTLGLELRRSLELAG
jgi:NADPH:quinone reductase-like Zn-dependent oxidoreductase